MKEFLPVLQQCVLFENIEPGDIPGMLNCLCATVKTFGKNTPILSEGEPAEFVGILLQGSANIVKQDYYGVRSIVGRVEQAQMFAESFACAGAEELPISVIANEACRVMLIPCRRITVGCANACSFHSQMIYNLMKAVAVRNLEFHQKLEIISKRTTREKLLAYLLMQAKLHGSDTFTIPYDRQALADYLGVERSAMSAEISKLRSEGILLSVRNQFTIL